MRVARRVISLSSLSGLPTRLQQWNRLPDVRSPTQVELILRRLVLHNSDRELLAASFRALGHGLPMKCTWILEEKIVGETVIIKAVASSVNRMTSILQSPKLWTRKNPQGCQTTASSEKTTLGNGHGHGHVVNDPKFRVAPVIPEGAHNHPKPPYAKIPEDVKELYGHIARRNGLRAAHLTANNSLGNADAVSASVPGELSSGNS
ncbi:hypothetical protein SISNIDRAFT_471240 [Sistotremastrum niveocremeum HHB9708]|uniref:Uncharacterized protein n=1 Tax=Sistotremastrum niveocremeum HHB9708 TaxID=1314777 RepID=A0A164MV18_9AGAM|nr:hypothetical protein SISNIDRAFT_471240 [Sistotremastrum niveocremeum HHB9708]